MNYSVSFSIDFKRNPYKGRFIALEGIDGCGKSTQAKRLKSILEKQGRVVSIRNPFEGEIGRFVRRILAGDQKVSPIALQFLISANRATQQEEIVQELQKGHDVIIDRYVWSAVVYGMSDYPQLTKKESFQWLTVSQGLLSHYHQFLIPDTTYYIDISSKTAINRMGTREGPKEIYEEESKVKRHEKLYKWVIKQFPNEFTIVNGEKDIDEITNVLVEHIAGLKKNV